MKHDRTGLSLVIGATGFIGSELTWQLLDEGMNVRILRRPDSSLDLLGKAAHLVDHAIGDVTDSLSLQKAMAGVDHVYHSAAVLGSAAEPSNLRKVNAEGTANVVEAALEVGIRRLVFTSSNAALGRFPGRLIDESVNWGESVASSAYGISKHEAEVEIERGVARGLDAVMVNPTRVWGINRSSSYARYSDERIRFGKHYAVPKGGSNVVDVVDVAAGHRLAMKHGRTGHRYLLAGENLSWRKIADTFAKTCDMEPPRREITYGALRGRAVLAETLAFILRQPTGMTRQWARNMTQFHRYDNSKAINEIGFSFCPFAETAQRVAKEIKAERSNHCA